MARYVLPDLEYDYGALEPRLSGRIMELHHDEHHRSYVDTANETLEKLDEARADEDYTRVAALEHALAFHLSGHILHSIFWQNLSPHGGGRPEGALGTAIDTDFGSFDAMQKQMNEVAATIMGSGWAALVWEPLGKRLLVTTSEARGLLFS